MTRKAHFEQKARQCRRLLTGVTDVRTTSALKALAEEFDAKANAEALPPGKSVERRSIDRLGNGHDVPIAPTSRIAK